MYQDKTKRIVACRRMQGESGGNEVARLGVYAIVDIRKQIVPPFNLAQPRLIDLTAFDFFVQMIEVEDVDFGPLPGIIDHRAGLHDECPVARLSQQQLAGGLVEGPAAQRIGVREFLGQLDHAALNVKLTTSFIEKLGWLI